MLLAGCPHKVCVDIATKCCKLHQITILCDFVLYSVQTQFSGWFLRLKHLDVGWRFGALHRRLRMRATRMAPVKRRRFLFAFNAFWCHLEIYIGLDMPWLYWPVSINCPISLLILVASESIWCENGPLSALQNAAHCIYADLFSFPCMQHLNTY